MSDRIDWDAVPTEKAETKKTEVETIASLPPSKTSPPLTSNVELPKIKRNKQSKEDASNKHASLIELEHSEALTRTELAQFRQDFEEFKMGMGNQLARIQVLVQALSARTLIDCKHDKTFLQLKHELAVP